MSFYCVTIRKIQYIPLTITLIVTCPKGATWQPEVNIFSLLVSKVHGNLLLTVFVTISIAIFICLFDSFCDRLIGFSFGIFLKCP